MRNLFEKSKFKMLFMNIYIKFDSAHQEESFNIYIFRQYEFIIIREF